MAATLSWVVPILKRVIVNFQPCSDRQHRIGKDNA